MAWLDSDLVPYWLLSCCDRFPNVMRGIGSCGSWWFIYEGGRCLAGDGDSRHVGVVSWIQSSAWSLSLSWSWVCGVGVVVVVVIVVVMYSIGHVGASVGSTVSTSLLRGNHG